MNTPFRIKRQAVFKRTICKLLEEHEAPQYLIDQVWAISEDLTANTVANKVKISDKNVPYAQLILSAGVPERILLRYMEKAGSNTVNKGKRYGGSKKRKAGKRK